MQSVPLQKDLLLQNEKLIQAQEEKVQILVAIHASLPAIAEKAALLWAARVPDLDAAIIMGEATSSSQEPGTSTGGNPQGPGPSWGLWHHDLNGSPQVFCTPWICQPTSL